jgi:SAM-dependent methyltransferase
VTRPPDPVSLLRTQYERFPYPPIPFLALPRAREGDRLRLKDHRGKRILVAGSGTLEALVVAQAHPDASEIVAVDLSARSIAISKKRFAFFRMARPFTKLPSIQFVVGDLTYLDLGKFDYILASNLLHHSENPPLLLLNLTRRLLENGVIRVVTYPKGSRFWMRKTSEWLKSRGLTPSTDRLVKKSRELIRTLPLGHPIRSCFDSQPETRTLPGLVDAFFNACENPLSPLEWARASQSSGLELMEEGQNTDSRSSFLDPFLGAGKLNIWEKLQILDDTWELCSNPVLWFRKTHAEKSRASDFVPASQETFETGLKRAEGLMNQAGKTLLDYQNWLRREVGPRVSPKHPSELLRGLSLTEYDLSQLDLISALAGGAVTGAAAAAVDGAVAAAGVAADSGEASDFFSPPRL